MRDLPVTSLHVYYMSNLQLIAIVAACVLLAPTTLAQRAVPSKGFPAAPAVRSNTNGLFLQAHLNGTGLSVDSEDAEGGNGFGLKAGYGFSPLFTLYAGFDAANMDAIGGGDYAYGFFDLGAQFNFRSGAHALVPYIDVALSGQAAILDVAGDDLTFSGAGLSFGGGVKYFVSPVLALDGALTVTRGSFNEAEYLGDRETLDVTTNSARIGLGISWYPFR